MRHEISKMLAKVFEMRKEERVPRANVVRELLISQEEINTLIFGLILTNVSTKTTFRMLSKLTNQIH